MVKMILIVVLILMTMMMMQLGKLYGLSNTCFCTNIRHGFVAFDGIDFCCIFAFFVVKLLDALLCLQSFQSSIQLKTQDSTTTSLYAMLRRDPPGLIDSLEWRLLYKKPSAGFDLVPSDWLILIDHG